MEKYSYTAFAYVYDELMDNVPYDEWAEYLIGLLKENGVADGLVCELGCGTGQMTRRLAAAGYDMIGIDLSEDMLDVAREQEYGAYEGESDVDEEADLAEPSILYLQQDMRSFELYGTVSAVVSICDSMNYMTTDEDMLQVFRLVNNYLDKDGVFIFDMNTEYKYKELMGDTTIAENREDVSFIWENLYDEEKRLNEYCLTLFAKVEAEDEDEENGESGRTALYEKYEEVHLQRAYPLEEVKRLLSEAGMTFVAAYDVLTHEAPGPECERMYIVAKEGHQSGKTYL
ncbi:MAG: class I SAM-dependent methyltransferase [Lachnospiraceae bacterium]|nr:class I SAM-dependent methyltransferase [Lachnospiraceae bacterium]